MANEIIQVEVLKREDYTLWDELVYKSPQGTIFHSADWSSTYDQHLGKELKIFGCFRAGHLVAGCLFYVYKKAFLKIAASISMNNPFGGIVLEEPLTCEVKKNEQNIRDIVKALCTSFENERFDKIHLVNSPDFSDIRAFVWNGWNTSIYYSYYLDLETFGSNISKDARWTINKAKKNGVSVEESDDITTFWKLWTDTYMRQKIRPPASEDFFREMLTLVQNQNKGKMLIAKTKSGEVAAAEIFVHDNKRAYRWSAASQTELRKTGAPSLLLYEMLQLLKKEHFTEINLMAASSPNLATFVAQLNPRLVPYYGVEKKSKRAKIAAYLAHSFRLRV